MVLNLIWLFVCMSVFLTTVVRLTSFSDSDTGLDIVYKVLTNIVRVFRK